MRAQFLRHIKCSSVRQKYFYLKLQRLEPGKGGVCFYPPPSPSVGPAPHPSLLHPSPVWSVLFRTTWPPPNLSAAPPPRMNPTLAAEWPAHRHWACFSATPPSSPCSHSGPPPFGASSLTLLLASLALSSPSLWFLGTCQPPVKAFTDNRAAFGKASPLPPWISLLSTWQDQPRHALGLLLASGRHLRQAGPAWGQTGWER